MSPCPYRDSHEWQNDCIFESHNVSSSLWILSNVTTINIYLPLPVTSFSEEAQGTF